MFSENPKSKFWSNRNEKKPNEVALNSHKKFWFDCECGHQFDIALNCLNKGSWCSYCANKKLCELNRDCKICFDKCFASVEYSKNWSDKNFEEPFEVFKNSHKEYLFDCIICKHIFKQKLSHITRGNTCNYCHNLIMCNKESNCKSCYNKSFASLERSAFWSNKNKKQPIDVFKSTAEKFWFDCHKCGNNFESKLCHITDGSWCPKCRYKTEDKFIFNYFTNLSNFKPTI